MARGAEIVDREFVVAVSELEGRMASSVRVYCTSK